MPMPTKYFQSLSDEQLSTQMAGWNPQSDNHILAEKEWQSRLMSRQLREQFEFNKKLAEFSAKQNRRNTRLTVAVAFAGIVIGAAITMTAPILSPMLTAALLAQKEREGSPQAQRSIESAKLQEPTHAKPEAKPISSVAPRK